MLLNVSEKEVLTAAEALGDELQTAKSESAPSVFESTLIECTDTITAEVGLEYGEVCDSDSGSDCC